MYELISRGFSSIMSLSTLLEAAKYLDYLDSNNLQQQQQLQHHEQQKQPQQQQYQHQHQQQPQFLSHQPQLISKKPAVRSRQRASKKSAANAMLAMSLPASTGPLQMQGAPIPIVGDHNNSIQNHNQNHNQAATSLSSSFTTGSPLSSFASTALLCSRASGVTSNSSSAASSLSSSYSSSSCGEILILAFQPTTASSPTSSTSSYSRHRELHKTLEKNRRAHLRHCFELLKAELPASECVDKKTSHINIIKSAIRYVLALRQQESEIDDELQRLTKIKNELTENLSKLCANQPAQDQLQLQQQQHFNLQLKPSHSTGGIIKQELNQPQQPAAEQQLSFLLSQSKID